MLGGWAKFRVITSEEAEFFSASIEHLDGIAYEPLIVSTQAVAGENYMFLCNARTMTEPQKHYLAKLVIYAPMQKQSKEGGIIAHISEVEL